MLSLIIVFHGVPRGRIIACALVAAATACGGRVPSVKAPEPIRYDGVSSLAADLSCAYGAADCNPCVPYVRASFLRLAGHPSAKFRYLSGENRRLPPWNKLLPGFNLTDHVQAFARVPGVGDENWLVGTRSQPDQPNGRAGFFMVHMSALSGSGGEAFTSNGSLPVNSGDQGTEFFYPMYGTDHPGGAQMLGRLFAIGAECAGYQFLNKNMGPCSGTPFIDFYDLTNPAHARLVNRFTLDGKSGEPNQAVPGRRGYATAVAVTRLADQRYLLLALGKDRRAEGWFYLSDDTRISETTHWRFLQYWNHRFALPDESSWTEGYQNVNFVNECQTGNVYAIAMGLDGSREEAHLFKLVSETSDGSSSSPPTLDEHSFLSFSREADITLQPFEGQYCTVRAGSGVHVTPSGKMLIYCSTRNSAKSMLKFEEYAGQPEPLVRSASAK